MKLFALSILPLCVLSLPVLKDGKVDPSILGPEMVASSGFSPNEAVPSECVPGTDALSESSPASPPRSLHEIDFSTLILLGEVSSEFVPSLLRDAPNHYRKIVDSLKTAPEEEAVVHIPTQRGAARPAQAIKEGDPPPSGTQVPGLENVPEEVDGLRLTHAERTLIAITNLERAKRGIKPVAPSRKLMESARKQAAWMAVTGIFRHGAVAAAENIAMGQRSSGAAMQAWMRSDGHRRNLLGAQHGHIGVGAYRSSGGQMYWCQQFTR